MIEVVTNATQGDFGRTGPGDSGSRLIYELFEGGQLILSVLTLGGGKDWAGYSRIDLPEVIDFIDCAYIPGSAADVLDCVDNL